MREKRGKLAMAYDCRVYRILIGSPSDVDEEREIAVRVIQEWNDLNSYSRKVALLPLRWETHTAPEYGIRPQEVINRQIVDECDLLVGIFWTRIGTPTGRADSGTIEEIERVGNAGKPVMLYFSRVGIDPDRIDLKQVEKLQTFKTNTYPNGLIESYKSMVEFRDKFWRQLEIKIRDLQRNDTSKKAPLSLEFITSDAGDKTNDNPNYIVERPFISNTENIPIEAQNLLMKTIQDEIDRRSTVPIAMIIMNSSASGVRNLYVKMKVSSAAEQTRIREVFDDSEHWKVTFSHKLFGFRKKINISQNLLRF